MKKIVVAAMIVLTGLSVALANADAGSLNGGDSLGKQSETLNRPPSVQLAAPSPTSSGAVREASVPGVAMAPAAVRAWAHSLSVALLGLGLGALLAQFGIGGALAGMIASVLIVSLVLVAAVLLYRLLRGKSEQGGPPYAYAMQSLEGTGMPGMRREPSLHPIGFHADAQAQAAPVIDLGPGAAIPLDFDVPVFIKHAKTCFLRLQAAWDGADIADIRQFTSPELFAELRMQLQGRGASTNQTEVVQLDANVLSVETVGDDFEADVGFSGLIAEPAGAQPQAFAEVWTLTRPASGNGGWLLAAIRQLS